MCDQYDAFAFAALLWVTRSLILDFEEFFNDCAGKLGQKANRLSLLLT